MPKFSSQTHGRRKQRAYINNPDQILVKSAKQALKNQLLSLIVQDHVHAKFVVAIFVKICSSLRAHHNNSNFKTTV